MSLLAKSIVKDQCWVVEDDGFQVGTILSNPKGVVFTYHHKKEQFASLKILSDRYNIKVEKTPKKRKITEEHKVHGYPCDFNAHNILWDVKHKVPIFTKGRKSKSFFCAGYYIVKFNNGWVKSSICFLMNNSKAPVMLGGLGRGASISKIRPISRTACEVVGPKAAILVVP